MTENKRIVLNVIATYGRSLYALVLGLLCGRWALMALGEVDYGLNGLVGGLAVFITFFNGVLAGANSRFYAFSVGAAKVADDKALAIEECRHWFNTALSVHLVVPLVLILICYPLGTYAINHWLTIPLDRISDCVWVFRFVSISCLFAMINVPFQAMYRAKQYIAELTIYSFVTSTLNVVALYYMISHPDVWLVPYAAWTCVLSVVPQLIISWRACTIFPECKINVRYMWDWARIKKLGSFAGWQMSGVLCAILRTNGISIVTNKFFGAAMNAAQALGNTVQAQCNTLASAMQGAFSPVIVQACGAGNYKKMNVFVIRTSKFNVLLSLVFMLPLALELPKVMQLWLIAPPDYAVGLCYCAMLYHLVGSCTFGQMVAVNAVGKIAVYHAVLCSFGILTVPLAIIVGLIWHDVYAISGTVIVMEILNSIGRLYFARQLAGTSVVQWLCQVFSPAVIVVALCGGIGLLPRLIMPESFLRICVTTMLCEIVFLPFTWFVFLSNDERAFLSNRFISRITQVLGRTRNTDSWRV